MNAPTTTASHRLLVVNCYPRESRENFDRSDVGHPHDLFKAFLAQEAPNATAEVVFIADPGFALPAGTTIGDFDGVIWTGSDLTVNETTDPRVAPQLVLAEQLLDAAKPSWGSCWGIQLASLVAGGEVAVNPRGREWGIARTITLTEAAAAAPMHVGKPASFDAFIMHLDEVTRLPDATPLLATNEHTTVQAAIIGSFWATQYHPEYDLHEMGRLIAARAEALVREGFFPDSGAVAHHAMRMKQLAAEPDSVELRAELGVGDDLLDPQIRQVELRNWLRFVDSHTPQERGRPRDGSTPGAAQVRAGLHRPAQVGPPPSRARTGATTSPDRVEGAGWVGRQRSKEGCPVDIDRQEIVDQLRGRNEDDVADRAERELPEVVDTDEHADLLHRLGINPTDLLGGIAGTFG